MVGGRRLQLIQLLLAIGFAALAILVFRRVGDLVMVLIASILITYILRPIVVRLESLGIARVYSILGIYLIGIGLAVVALRFFVPLLVNEMMAFVSSLNQADILRYYADGVNWIDKHIPGLASLFNLHENSGDIWIGRLRETAATFAQRSLSVAAGMMNLIALATVVPFVTFFFLKDGDRSVKKVIARVPNRFFEMALSLTYRIDKQLGNYIQSLLWESLMVGILTWLALAILGVKFSLLLGLTNGLLNVIPFVGPIIAYFPIGLVILLTYSPVGWGLLWMVIILIGVQMLDNILLKPLIISKSVDIHPVAVIIVVMIGGGIAGAGGMFLAVPIYSVLQVLVVDLYNHLKQYRII